MFNKLLFYVMTASHGVAEHAAEAVEHGGGHGEESHELPNLITLIDRTFAHHYDALIYAGVVALFMVGVAFITYRRRQMIPGRLQNLVEMLVEGLYNLIESVMGKKEARKFTPFLGTLFIYIWFMNLVGLIPLFKSSTSSINTTAALALTVFLYVQYTGMRRLGILGYFHHLLGSPNDAVTWALAPINLPIHLVGELAKPFSLALRLFGNITGEDILIAAFVSLGIMFMGIFGSPIGFPFQIPFILLALLTSTIQALVFTMLSTIYFFMMLPHEEHH
ncbi:MAG: ATP synthase F0 subunit A [Candidatus Zixiibacteriota bacterium]|nr:MAG: ATP synthase F0 subunit A [candidate division Zixibacteria bacterium]HDL04501.1 ATP synthase F0 subunit A [candidate division Zixibacteria bacterium]